MPDNRIKNIIRISFFLLLGIGFIWWFWSKLSDDEKEQMWLALKQADYIWFVLSALITVLSHYIRALRWNTLIESMGYKTGTKDSFLAVMGGYLTNLAVPRLGEVVRCGLLRKKTGIPIEKSLGTVITERAVDLLLFAFILLAALAFEAKTILGYVKGNMNINTDKLYVLSAVAIAVIILCLSAFLLLRKRLGNNKIFVKLAELFKGLWLGIKSITQLKRPVTFVVCSVTIWLLWICGTYTIFLSLGQTSALDFVQAMTTTVTGAIGPMITPGGIGLQPAIFAEVLLVYGISKPVGYACGWLCWTVSQIGTIVLGLAAFVYFASNKKKS